MSPPPWLRKGLLVVGALLVAAQFLPFGRVDNPPVTAEPSWDSPRTRELVVRSCFDCHSNESRREWYHLAPISWLVAYDVAQAREHLNFSEWDREQDHADDAAEEVADGEMPLRRYLLVHPSARLSPGEREELVAGLVATLEGHDESPREEGRAEGIEQDEDDDGRSGRGRGRGRGRSGRGRDGA